jgi:uncharacterized short protein YbdD (DUF466 family)
METKFSNFNKEEYKEIRRFIRAFSKEKTGNDSFSHFMKNDYYHNNLQLLENKIQNKFSITLEQFFHKYNDKIYNDKKFTKCCGLLDVLLYRYNKDYLLGGDLHADAGSKYEYGYQNYSLGIMFIKQRFGSLQNFYNEVIDNFKMYFNKSYYEVINYVEEDCSLIFIHTNNTKYAKDDYEYWTDIDKDITVFLIGDSKTMSDLINNIDRGNIDEYVDYDTIKNDIMLHEDTKKYNL